MLDEAAYASSDLAFETIFPLLEMKNTAFVAISTVLDQFNFFSKLLALKDEDGEDFFDVIMVDTTCDSCKRKLPQRQWKDCTHINDTVLPPWKSKDKYMRAKILQTADPNAGRNARESMGLVEGDYKRALNDEYVHRTFDSATRRTKNVERHPKRVYIAIDPDGGGAGSRMSVVSGYVCMTDNDEYPCTVVVTGMDFKRCTSDKEAIDLVKEHILTLRKKVQYENALFVLVPENQTGHFHSRIERKFKNPDKWPKCKTFHDHNKEKAGVRKDKERTRDYVHVTNDKLEDDLVKFDVDWFTNSAEGQPTGKEYVMTELKDQLLR